VAILLTLAGCSRAPVPTGGTIGRLTLGGAPLAEVRIEVLDDQRKVIGFGQTDPQGAFTIVSGDGKSPLTLSAGSHGVRLAPLGPVPPPLPTEAMDPARSTLRIEVGADGRAADLDLPESTPKR